MSEPTVPVSTEKLNEFLRSKADLVRPAKEADSCTTAGCFIPLGIGASLGGWMADLTWLAGAGIAVLMIGVIAAVVASGRAKQKQAQAHLKQEHVDGVLGDFVWLFDQRTLATRVHPRALPLLEACAGARSQAIASLETEVWKERAKDANWAQIRTSAIEAAEGAMLDALTASRDLVRTKGMKQAVFTARCADETYGSDALARLETIKHDLEELAGRVKVEVSAPEPEQSSIRKVLSDLHEVHVATAELDGEVTRIQE